jgi:hypothetical protein
MKKLIFLFFAFTVMHVSGQNLKSLSKSVTSAGGPMIEGLAADQVKSLTKKLNLNESQQEMVSGLVVSQLKSEKFQKLIGNLGGNSMMNSMMNSSDKDATTKKIESALLNDQEFQNGMSSIIDENQMKTLETFIPK